MYKKKKKNPAGCEFFLAPDKDPLNVPSLCIPL